MTLYASQGQLAFTLEGTGVPQNQRNEAYAVWLTSPAAARSGSASPSRSARTASSAPPARAARTPTSSRAGSPRYKQVVVSRERDGNAKQPGPIVLRGDLPQRPVAASSLPGFMTPAGSQRSLTTRSTSCPSGPISAASHGAWSAPTAWWWVIVPPAATIASLAAALRARHCADRVVAVLRRRAP